MKRKGTILLLILTAVFGALCCGFFLGRNLTVSPVQVTYVQVKPTENTLSSQTEESQAGQYPVNINSADKEALMRLPGVGDVLAQRILLYRESNGPYGSVAELMNVEGIGEQRLEELLPYATVGG